jgi:hypothetical protein
VFAGGADEAGVDGSWVDLVDDALGVGAGVVVEPEVPPQAATPVRRAATPSAWRGRRIDKEVEEIVMTPHCNFDDETTMRAWGSRLVAL